MTEEYIHVGYDIHRTPSGMLNREPIYKKASDIEVGQGVKISTHINEYTTAQITSLYMQQRQLQEI